MADNQECPDCGEDLLQTPHGIESCQNRFWFGFLFTLFLNILAFPLGFYYKRDTHAHKTFVDGFISGVVANIIISLVVVLIYFFLIKKA